VLRRAADTVGRTSVAVMTQQERAAQRADAGRPALPRSRQRVSASGFTLLIGAPAA